MFRFNDPNKLPHQQKKLHIISTIYFENNDALKVYKHTEMYNSLLDSVSI